MALPASTRLGFIGTGTITEAIVTGILSGGENLPDIIVSPRSAATAGRLAARSPKVRIAGDNRQVVDEADMVFLAIRPDVAEEVVRALHFRPGQLVVSLVATVDQESLRQWIDAPVEIVRAVPLPFVATRSGVTVVFPPAPAVEAFFAALGTAVPCRSVEEFALLTTASTLMGSYFGIMDHVVGWLGEKGMPTEQARAYLAPLFSSLSAVAVNAPSRSLEDLRHEYSTKGGLNEQMFARFHAHGGTDALTTALESVLDRVRKR
ncbi:MAG: pyrroline-5-carboxylate reductase [Rhizobium sp. 63-7]|nr:MAG: pyrroline-5-carboxylate reductase [Rhizobium sp. 63-7]